MDQDLRKLLTLLGVTGMIGFGFGVARGILQSRHDGWFGFIRGILASMVVAVIIGLALASTSLSQTFQAAVIGACAFVADDVIVGFGMVIKLIVSDPMAFFGRFISAWRGNASVSISVSGPPPTTSPPVAPPVPTSKHKGDKTC